MDWAKAHFPSPTPSSPGLRGSGRNGTDAERSGATHERGGAIQDRRDKRERSRKGWRGGLERSRARLGWAAILTRLVTVCGSDIQSRM